MPRRKSRGPDNPVEDYRHEEATRVNNPPAGLAPSFEKLTREKKTYAFDPHLDPQLVWAGKAGLKAYEFDEGQTSFTVDTVSLHIHERVSAKAILQAAKKPSPVGDLFADSDLPMDKQLEFYQHEMGWVNRLILGDSLLVMNSLLVKEGMAGKVQMIYIDPPYGIKYASNFQPRIDRRDVKDADEDLTREPEQIKAYRDTWELGIHSYLSYLRDRLLLSRELLHESGSVFVQINDENLHLVRCLMDEVFGRENFVATIPFKKTATSTAVLLSVVYDYLLWYARNKETIKFRTLLVSRPQDMLDRAFSWVERYDSSIIRITRALKAIDGRRFQSSSVMSQHPSKERSKPYIFEGKAWTPTQNRQWSASHEGLDRLAKAERLLGVGNTLTYKRYADDFPFVELSNVWNDTMESTFAVERLYAVQTAPKVLDRCILMTTDPGDLVLDPTCGSGTTSYCAEKWGRRWITIDTSRVALAIARQRILTAKFDYYKLKDPDRGPAGGFNYKTVPHITLESIAHNEEIDEIAARYQPKIDKALSDLNKATGKDFKEWEVPSEPEKTWPKKALDAHRAFRELKLAKRKEIDESIARHAPTETLYDQPEAERGIVRVSGPFTVEAIPPPVQDPTHFKLPERVDSEAVAGDFIDTILENLRKTGITFSGGKRFALENLRKLGHGFLHLEGEAKRNGDAIRVAVSLGPKEGPMTAVQAIEAIRSATINGYSMLVLAGFAFEPTVSGIAMKAKNLEVHMCNMNPDMLVGDLLKTTRASQLFSVFGWPDIRIKKLKDEKLAVELLGVDIYDPNTGEVHSEPGKSVAAWFLDTDYDAATFHICQAFFPGGKDPWDKLKRALKAEIPPEAFERMRGTESFPFEIGKNKRIAVKVIDFRGNEVMRVEEVE